MIDLKFKSMIEDQEPTAEELSQMEGNFHTHGCEGCGVPFQCEQCCEEDDYPKLCGLCEILEDK